MAWVLYQALIHSGCRLPVRVTLRCADRWRLRLVSSANQGDDAVQQRAFAGNVPVQRHHFPVEGLPETAHRQGLGTFGVHDLQGGCRDAVGAHARAAALGWPGGDVHAVAHLLPLREQVPLHGLPYKLTP